MSEREAYWRHKLINQNYDELTKEIVQLEAELATCRERIVRYAKERVAIVKAKQALEDALLTGEKPETPISDVPITP